MKKLVLLVVFIASLEAAEMPVRFEPDGGRFVARAAGYTLAVDSRGAALVPLGATQAVRMALAGSRDTAACHGVDVQPGVSNYLSGPDRAAWRTGVPGYARVECPGVYPGIDLVYYSNQRSLEYDLVIAPGADPTAARLVFPAPARLSIIDGDLRIESGERTFTLRKPRISQDSASIAGGFELASANEVRFRIGAYDHARPLTIDPTFLFSQYVGGSGDDSFNGLAVDSSGNTYAAGFTTSANFPNIGATTNSGASAILVKYDSAGKPVYSTYINGTSANTYGFGVAVDSTGNVYLGGWTQASNFPTTTGAFQTSYRSSSSGANGFVVKLNPAGTSILAATLIGGSSFDRALKLALDGGGHVFLAGVANSANFPLKNAIVSTIGTSGAAGFLCEFASDLSQLVYSTFIGGSGGYDWTNALAVDSAGSAYVVGQTNSTNFPIKGSVLQTTLPSKGKGASFPYSAYVTKLDSAGNLLLSTYYGGTGYEYANAVDVDSAGNVYVAGYSGSSDLPGTTGSYQATNPNAKQACFVARFDSGLKTVLATYYGGSGQVFDTARDIKVDVNGDIQVIGSVGSLTLDSKSSASDLNYHAFVALFSNDLSTLGEAVQLSTGTVANANGFANALAVPAVSGTVAVISGNTLPCTVSSSSATPPSVRGEGQAELLSDILVQCNSMPARGTSLVANITVTYVGPANQQIPVSGGAALLYDSNQASVPVSATSVYQGLAAGNQLQFYGIPISPPTTAGNGRVFRISDVRANINSAGVGGALAAGSTISAIVNGMIGPSVAPVNSIVAGQISAGATLLSASNSESGPSDAFFSGMRLATPSGPSTVFNATSLAVATTVGPLTITSQNLPGDALYVTATVVGKPRTGAAFVDPNTSPAPIAQNIPSATYNSESGHYDPAIPATNSGLASFGTRIKATFSNIPAGAQVLVGITNRNPNSSATASLTATETGPFQSVSATAAGFAPVSISNGSGVSVWEVLAANPTSPLNLTFPIRYTAGSTAPTGVPTVRLSYAPSPSGTAYTASATGNSLPVPRFIDASSSAIPLADGGNTSTTTTLVVPAGALQLFSNLPGAVSIPVTSSGNSIDTLTVSVANSPSWLSATLNSANTPAVLTIKADATGLAANVYTANIAISGNGVAPVTLPVQFTVTNCSLPLSPTVTSVINAGSYATSISPNALIAVKGFGFQPAGATHVAGAADFINNAFPPQMNCVAVLVDGVPAPLTFTSANQINAQAPAAMQAGTVHVQVVVNPGTPNAVYSVAFPATSVPISPAFFTFDGVSIAARNALTSAIIADPSLGIPGAAPAKPGDYLSLYGTGFGATNPVVLEGQVDLGRADITQALTVSIGGTIIPASAILYGGLSPFSISGLYQINVQVPTTIADGNQPVTVTINGQTTQTGAIIAVKH